jgi:adenosylcobyric acid synthase
MNPVLLKPECERGAQVIVQGRRAATMSARDYMAARGRFCRPSSTAMTGWPPKPIIMLVEGAGSPAEINLRQGDLANMGFAAAVGIPVVLSATSIAAA